MKRSLLVLLIFVLLASLIGCGSTQSKEAAPEKKQNPIAGRVYAVNKGDSDGLGWKWCKFYDDGTYQGVKSEYLQTVNGKRLYSRSSSYGTYTLDGAALTMQSGEKSYSAVIKYDGYQIFIGEIELLDQTKEMAGDSIMEEFDK